MEANDKIAIYRAVLDGLDDHIVGLYKKRLAVSREIGKLKAGQNGEIARPDREKEIFDRLEKKSGEDFEYVKALYELIFEQSKDIQWKIKEQTKAQS